MLKVINAQRGIYTQKETGKTVIYWTCIIVNEKGSAISEIRIWQDEDPTGKVLECTPYIAWNPVTKTRELKYKLYALEEA